MLSDEAKQQALTAKSHFYSCVDQEAQTFSRYDLDVRDATNAIINHCATKLEIVEKTFAVEQAPTLFTERYVKGISQKAARQLLGILMAQQAQRKTNTEASN